MLQRLGFYPERETGRGNSGKRTCWLHASSVGEVQAARAVIAALKKKDNNIDIVLTTMTVHGNTVAKEQVGDSVRCLLAPLDVPWIVERAIAHIAPDIYICLETELWPVLINALSKKSIRIGMINGRISERSYGSYLKIRWILGKTMSQFDRMGVITEKDRKKYISLGCDPAAIAVFGNVKYDLSFDEDQKIIREGYKKQLKSDANEVFVAGSTHTGEESKLLLLYLDYLRQNNILFIVAPRHVERIPEIEKMLMQENLEYQLMSDIKSGRQQRTLDVILVDTMGDLAELYSVADFIFCGGSLVNKGGHNLIEAAVWQKAVFYGPSISDFVDAAEMLESVQAGMRVESVEELHRQIDYFRNHRQEYHRACVRAGEIARSMQGCANRQVDFILNENTTC